jgi:dienelactone hydrolase
MALSTSRTALALAVGLALAACGGRPTDAPTAPPPPAASPQRGEVHLGFFHDAAPVTKLQWAEPFVVRASGFIPGEEITLRASANLRGALYTSEAVFAADAAGAIDTSVLAPVRGAYASVDADGLMWSMTASKAKPDVELWGFHVDAIASGDDPAPLASATLSRWYTGPGVVRTPVGDGGLVGVFYADPSAGKQPVIVAFGGSEGGLDSGEGLAAFWGSRGYAALGLAYFAAPGLPDYLTEIPLEYFAKAFAWLDARPEADATRLAVMGGSRGGELALLLGATFARVGAVVADVPSGVSWGAPKTANSETASWTFGGAKIPWLAYATDVAPAQWKAFDGTTAESDRPQFEASIARATPAELEAASFAVEKTNGPILMLAGGDDQIWPSCALAQIATDRLAKNGHTAKYADDAVCYPDSGHASGGLPGTPTTLETASVHPITGDLLAMGGTPAGLARAQRDAFARVDAFLHKALR